MRQLLLLLSFLFLTELNAQTDNDFARFRRGSTISCGVGYRQLQVHPDLGDSTTQQFINLRDDNEIPSPNWTFGFPFQLRIARSFDIESGIVLDWKRYRTKVIEINTGGIAQDVSLKAKYTYAFVTIPFLLNTKHSLGQKSMSYTLGLNTNIFAYYRQKTIEKVDGDKNKFKQWGAEGVDFNRVNFSPYFAIGLEGDINDIATVKFQLFATYQLLPVVEAPINENLWSFGIRYSSYIDIKK